MGFRYNKILERPLDFPSIYPASPAMGMVTLEFHSWLCTFIFRRIFLVTILLNKFM